MTKNTRTVSRAPDLEDPYNILLRIMISSTVAGLAFFGVVATTYAILSSWGDPNNYNLVIVVGIMVAVLTYSIMSIREKLKASEFMGFM